MALLDTSKLVTLYFLYAVICLSIFNRFMSPEMLVDFEEYCEETEMIYR